MRCTKCKIVKDLDKFGTHTARGKIRKYTWCLDCMAQRCREWRKQNPDHVKGLRLKKYWPAATWQEALGNFLELLRKQNNVCAICKESPDVRKLSVDHNHTTGEVRGLLCSHCNHVLGKVRDNPTILLSAADYLNLQKGSR